jgi:hypothetical protein
MVLDLEEKVAAVVIPHNPLLGCISSFIGSYLTHERPTRPISKAKALGWESGSTFYSRDGFTARQNCAGDGASRGIGRATASALAEAGAHVLGGALMVAALLIPAFETSTSNRHGIA